MSAGISWSGKKEIKRMLSCCYFAYSWDQSVGSHGVQAHNLTRSNVSVSRRRYVRVERLWCFENKEQPVDFSLPTSG